MVGKHSGVLTKFKQIYPNIALWHCMCHRLELAVHDSVKATNQINYAQLFIEKLYSVYHQPKHQRELQECAKQLDTEFKKMGRIFTIRWSAFSWRTIDAIWRSHRALVEHMQTNSTSSTTYLGMLKIITSQQFVHSLAVLHDALKEIGIASEAL